MYYPLQEITAGTWPSELGSLRLETLVNPAGLGPEEVCAGEAQQQL
jgi:hypothetical protein